MSNAETSAVYAQEIMRLERENAAQLKELHGISEALGTNEGHSSVTHIEILKEENAALRKNVEKYRWFFLELDKENATLRGLLGRAAVAVEWGINDEYDHCAKGAAAGLLQEINAALKENEK